MDNGIEVSSSGKAVRGSRLCSWRSVHPVGADGLIAFALNVQGSDEVIRVALPWQEAKRLIASMQESLAPNPQDPLGAPVHRDQCHRLA